MLPFRHSSMYGYTVHVKRFLVEARAAAFVTAGFSFDDEPTLNSNDESTVATSTICPVTHHPLTPSSAEEGSYSHNLRRRSSCNLCACSIPPCATRTPGRGRACPTLPGSAVIYAEGTASRPPTAKGLADIGVQEDDICTRVVAQGPRSGPFAPLRAGSAAFPAVRVLAAPQLR